MFKGDIWAANMCDFALGTDTGGSTRIPASYCGIYGIRTTHGVISLEGVWPFMPSFDTVGWFSNDPVIFAAVGETLLPTLARRILGAVDIADRQTNHRRHRCSATVRRHSQCRTSGWCMSGTSQVDLAGSSPSTASRSASDAVSLLDVVVETGVPSRTTPSSRRAAGAIMSTHLARDG
jgi:hypothetical protein